MRWLTLPERAPGTTIACIGLIFVIAYSLGLLLLAKPDGRIVVGDAMHEYVQLRSAVFDHDLRFTNEYLHLYGLTPETVDDETRWIVDANETGHVRNLMPVGPALLWAPAYLMTTAGVWIADHLGAAYPLDGYGRLFQASAGYTGIAAATLAAWLSFLAAAAFFDRRSAIWATLAIWLASSALYYSVISPTYSHAPSMLAVSVFVLVWIRTLNEQRVGRYVLLGVLVGIAALMRWQDAVLFVVPALDAAVRWRARAWAAGLQRIAAAGAGAFVAFTPQMFVWQRLYGHPLTIPQGASFMQWQSPALVAVLFSDNHGLFTWTPVIALGCAGLIWLVRRAPLAGAASIAFLAISWYVNAAVADWWAGEAFGARRFVGCFPIFVLGTAAVFERWKDHPARAVVCTMIFTALTLLLLVQYQAFMHGARTLAPYPKGFEHLWLSRFVVPFRLLGAIVK
ncbi:MAG TPA: hypothetical protein VL262_06945 [Vicinamibacterales bacterium]|jgi:hypothetical protein|nr:hypothetical protein [Vicinamibacterales bacterium]